MTRPLHDLRARNVATTISTLQGMKRSRKTKDVKALDTIIADLQAKLKALKK